MDPLIGAALITGGAGLAGSFMGTSAAKASGKYALRVAREQMDFQERMSNTSHQRQTEDLEKAGLNRILSITGGSGGASTPIGAKADTPDFAGASMKGMSTALSLLKGIAEIRNIDTATNKTEAETDILGTQAELERDKLKVYRKAKDVITGGAGNSAKTINKVSQPKSQPKSKNFIGDNQINSIAQGALKLLQQK